MSLQQQVSDGFIRVTEAINTVDNKPTVLQEYASDPVSPAQGTAWILRTVLNPQGTFSGFFGGFVNTTTIDDNQFQLSVNTTYGIKRIELE